MMQMKSQGLVKYCLQVCCKYISSAVVTWTGCAAPSCVAVQERGEGVLAAELRSAAAACSGTSCSTPPAPGKYNEEK